MCNITEVGFVLSCISKSALCLASPSAKPSSPDFLSVNHTQHTGHAIQDDSDTPRSAPASRKGVPTNGASGAIKDHWPLTTGTEAGATDDMEPAGAEAAGLVKRKRQALPTYVDDTGMTRQLSPKDHRRLRRCRAYPLMKCQAHRKVSHANDNAAGSRKQT